MNKMIDTLLTLSRLDSGQISIQKESISLKGIIDGSWRYFADKAYDKDLVFINSIEGDVVCESDKDRLGMVISNILDNAVEYTNQGGRIHVYNEPSNSSIILSISNTGCRLTQGDVKHVFEFFWRKDTSRTDTGTHCGIGLSVAQKVAKALGIDIDINLKEDDIFTVRLKIVR
jgi:signal transduction histidine kinase